VEQHTYKGELAFPFDSSSKDTLNTNAHSYPSAGGDALAYASSGFVFCQNLSVSHAIQIVALFIIRVTTATAREAPASGSARRRYIHHKLARRFADPVV
jgi:hypothetical protein